MADYVTSAQLTVRFPQVSSWSDDDLDGTPNADVIAQAIDYAEGLINDAAGQHYEVPLANTEATTQEIILAHAGTLAGRWLATRVSDHEMLEALKEDWRYTEGWLKKIRDGRIYLDGETQRSVSRPAGDVVLKSDVTMSTGNSATKRSNMQGW